ncbi:MAG: hypothetical protein CVU59_02960 [Deltaproteobacteria bacterium HGW-Deltaproteobacteria-17]|nr:MAG: hypothetical protein CVU59_02960 [Deltaproteobacteria bacterium HGW-Deltaproteobacteria-17]
MSRRLWDLSTRLGAQWIMPARAFPDTDSDLHPDSLPANFTRLVIDSREVTPGCLFFALPGERTDGHRFVGTAFQKGACAAVVQQPPEGEPPGPCLLVESTRSALWEAGRMIREDLERVRMVGITGSCGKTSTKEFAAAALGFLGKTTATMGNANNDLGLPLTLSRFDGDEQFGVLEMGMNAFGEIDALSSVVTPEVGIVTSIFPAHLEGVGSLDGVRRAKGEMAAHVRKVWIVPDTEPTLIQLGRDRGLRVLTFGWTEGADFRVVSLECGQEHSDLRLSCPAGEFDARIPVPGEHQAGNALAALAAVHALGQPLEPAILGLEEARLPGSRSRILRVFGITVFDDCYNASPGSLAAVFGWIDKVRTGPLHLVLGDMLELGDESPRLHREAGVEAARLAPASVLYVGKQAASFAEGFGSRDHLTTCASPEEAADELLPRLAHGDWVLVKASHGVGLHRFVERLQELTSCACT